MSSLSAFGWIQSSLGIDITGEWQGIVNLNVGGVAFSCQRRTFKPAADTSILCKMALATDRNVPRSEDGSIIIDRDPETFRHVLNFLRANQKLILPDNFCEWDLLLEDARVYELPKLADEIRSNSKYQQRCFVESLPSGVMLRWVDNNNSSYSSSSSSSDGNSLSSKHKIDVFPPLQLFAVDVNSGSLMFQGRVVSSVDEAVAILLTTYQMTVDVWHRDTVIVSSSEKHLSHTVFMTKKK